MEEQAENGQRKSRSLGDLMWKLLGGGSRSLRPERKFASHILLLCIVVSRIFVYKYMRRESRMLCLSQLELCESVDISY